MLSLQAVTRSYPLGKEQVITAVRGVTLEVARGEFVVVTGRSGSGKTTLLHLAAGLLRPGAGRVLFDGVDLWRLSDGQLSALRNRRMGFVFQVPSLMPALTVLENVALPGLFGPRRERTAVRARARELLDRVGLSDKLHVHPRQLSAGQQQRVVIARALVHRPEVLLADEPTSNLDEQTEQEIMALFRAVHAETGVTVVLVTHAAQLVGAGTRAVTMAAGELRG